MWPARVRGEAGAPPAARPFTGAATGLVALAGIGLVAGLVLGPTTTSVVLATAVVTLPVALLARPAVRDAALDDLAAAATYARNLGAVRLVALAAGAGAIALAAWLVTDRVMVEGPNGIGTGFVNNLGDLPFHLQVVASFGWAGNLPPEDPTYAGAAFTWPSTCSLLAMRRDHGFP